MALKKFFVFNLVILATLFAAKTKGMPRDATAVRDDVVVRVDDVEYPSYNKVEVHTAASPPSPTVSHLYPNQISCEFEEATEVDICKEHCLPKGYSYGLCVGHRCSCV